MGRVYDLALNVRGRGLVALRGDPEPLVLRLAHAVGADRAWRGAPVGVRNDDGDERRRGVGVSRGPRRRWPRRRPRRLHRAAGVAPGARAAVHALRRCAHDADAACLQRLHDGRVRAARHLAGGAGDDAAHLEPLRRARRRVCRACRPRTRAGRRTWWSRRAPSGSPSSAPSTSVRSGCRCAARAHSSTAPATPTCSKACASSRSTRRCGACRPSPGSAPWTANVVAIRALGHADGVLVGDAGAPFVTTMALTGVRGDDARMVELLEPFRPHRARVHRLFDLADGHVPGVPPRRKPVVDRHRREPWRT